MPPSEPERRGPEDVGPPRDAGRRRLRIWLAGVSVIALAAAGVAAYALVESEQDAESGDRSMRELRGDLRALQSDVETWLENAESELEETAGDQEVEEVRNDLEQLQQRVQNLNEAVREDGGRSLSQRVDDLEQRVEDLEQQN